ncbi:thiamine diphosphate-binding protein [Trametes versicolor FP-101664 SS1]|uniref:thiamine diphosphate-binding protein n=1 Tax=Trametes versicolor (strain FP-101664) TaxID=717944 RepID=UPI0004624771|nr:thiamine diphosphate-binding protein [Trametes versicolor FP-101664 SS1]EIW52361.1 Thiamin diphosphate-binding protein [Trametes versicolor FP-101664 SS1]
MYTTASVFFKTLTDAGITHAFVNWGSDHSAFLEDLHRQRTELGKTVVEIVTCPSEYVALTAAHGYAQVTGNPAVVIVHVDVGTQALAGAVHNVDRGQAPVLIFAGSSPFSANGELRGTKNEFIMWIQDVPDQPAIVRQYMRYVGQIHSGKNASKVIMRALQIATSQPKGPVYLWARREVTDEDVDEATMNAIVPLQKWPSVAPPALTPYAVETIVAALTQADYPLIVTANAGRNPAAVPLLAELSNALAAGVISCAPSSLALPSSHPYHLGYFFGGKLPYLPDADVVILLDVDVPWVDVNDNAPREGARVFVIDTDPLKRTFGWSHVDAEMLCTADAATALLQLIEAVRASDAHAFSAKLQARKQLLDASRATWRAQLSHAETLLAPDRVKPSVPFLLSALRTAVSAGTPSAGKKVLWLNEAASASGLIWNHIGADTPGSMFMSGGTSLGWVLGASVGASIGAKVAGTGVELVVSLTGDGNYLFGAPAATFWVARRYDTPFLMVILNNRGWFSPKYSMRAMHPTGLGSAVSGEKLTVGFGEEHNADYAGVAAAAGGAWARQVARADELRGAFEEAIKVVMEERRCAVIDCIIESI